MVLGNFESTPLNIDNIKQLAFVFVATVIIVM